ncbi:hypothetical protein SESBI_02311 [Sesbania bispinosa]|nr:hypothetical protein SESBI_02311 [Sesbania bispinosa]
MSRTAQPHLGMGGGDTAVWGKKRKACGDANTRGTGSVHGHACGRTRMTRQREGSRWYGDEWRLDRDDAAEGSGRGVTGGGCVDGWRLDEDGATEGEGRGGTEMTSTELRAIAYALHFVWRDEIRSLWIESNFALAIHLTKCLVHTLICILPFYARFKLGRIGVECSFFSLL